MFNVRTMLFMLGLCLALQECALAGPCDLKSLPDSIQASLAKEYPDWKIVTSSRLEKSDRDTWLQDYPKECPGMAKGRFSAEDYGYVFNLLKSSNGNLYQQIVYFEPHGDEFKATTIFPITKIKIVTVIRKFAPGMYKPVAGGKAVMIKNDTIGVSQIDAWTAVYYWDGSRFRQMVTSD